MPYIGLIVMVVWVGALIDVICADEHRVRNLPKTLWLIIVITLPMVGSVLWLLVGRPEGRDMDATGLVAFSRAGVPRVRPAGSAGRAAFRIGRGVPATVPGASRAAAARREGTRAAAHRGRRRQRRVTSAVIYCETGDFRWPRSGVADGWQTEPKRSSVFVHHRIEHVPREQPVVA